MISKKQARRYCKDNINMIENYEQAISDTTQTWHCHHRRETIYDAKELMEIGEYYHRPAIELIFLTPHQHMNTYHIGKEAGWYISAKKHIGMKYRVSERKHYQPKGCHNTRKYANSSVSELIQAVLDDGISVYERKWICENLLQGVLCYGDIRTKNRRREYLKIK